jgi:hypothetical protein
MINHFAAMLTASIISHCNGSHPARQAAVSTGEIALVCRSSPTSASAISGAENKP